MDTLTAEEAAAFLRLNVKRIQGLAREGKLPASRVGRKWLFRRVDLERLLAIDHPAATPVEPFAALSARNHLLGRITNLRIEGIMAEVEIDIGGQKLVSVITSSSAIRLRLEVGQQVYAIMKSTEVMIGREPIA
jgi:molybdopterin-binding protein